MKRLMASLAVIVFVLIGGGIVLFVHGAGIWIVIPVLMIAAGALQIVKVIRKR